MENNRVPSCLRSWVFILDWLTLYILFLCYQQHIYDLLIDWMWEVTCSCAGDRNEWISETTVYVSDHSFTVQHSRQQEASFVRLCFQKRHGRYQVHKLWHCSAILFRPHCSTLFVDAAYCYRWSSIVCLSVWCVSLSRSWALQKWLNRSRCCLGCGVGMSPRKHTLDGMHIGNNWRIQLNHPRAAEMRSFVKLLWPLAA